LRYADSVAVLGNTIQNCDSTGIGVYVYYSNYDTISGNVVRSNKRKFSKGIYLTGSPYARIEKDTVSNCSDYGVYCYNSGNQIVENTITDCGGSGVGIEVIGSSSNPNVTGNQIKADTAGYSCSVGIQVETNGQGKARNNRIEDFVDAGIYSTNRLTDCGTLADWGMNSIYWNFDNKGSSTGSDLVNNGDVSDTLQAQYNYFGPSPSSGMFSGKVKWSNYLSSDPNAYFYADFSLPGDTIYWRKSNGGSFKIEGYEYSDSSSNSNQWSYVDSLKIKDIVMEVQVQNKRFTSTGRKGANVGVRFKDTSNYVMVSYDKSADKIYLQIDSVGNLKRMDSLSSAGIDSLKKDTLRIVAYGNDYQVWRNKVVKLKAVRAATYLGDKAGVMTAYSGGYSHSHFDNVEIYPCLFFDNLNDNRTSWDSISGTWAIEGSDSLSGTGANDTGIVLVKNIRLMNYVVECDAKVIADTGWILLRYRNSKNYIGLRLRTNSITLGIKAGGTWTPHDSTTDTVKTIMQNIKISAVGDNYAVYYNGVKKMDRVIKSDSITSSSTRLGLRVGRNSGHVHFDNYLVTKHIIGDKGTLGKLAYQPDELMLKILNPAIEEKLTNYPNPFGMGTEILYSVQYNKNRPQVMAKLGVYDYSGQLVRMLVDEVKAPGMYGTTWDGNDAHGRQAEAGVYFYRLEAGDKTVVKKMIKCK
jgi:parallel beta-helix repeat protein